MNMAFRLFFQRTCSAHSKLLLSSGQLAKNNLLIWRSFTSPASTFKYADLQVQKSTNLKEKPDPDTLIFGKNFTDHMLTIEWSSTEGWHAPKISPFANLSLHPASSVFHYAVELYEGLKAYRGVDGSVRVFRPYENMKRMLNTAARATLPLFDSAELVQCIAHLVNLDIDWVPPSTTSSLYIRPTFIGIEPSLGINNSNKALLFVILCPVGPYFKTGTFSPVSLYADTANVRAWKGGVGNFKLGSNYGPTIHPQKAAEKMGCQQILWLYGEDHYLTEVGTMNIFILWENENGEKELLSPPLDGTILPGITRKSLLELGEEWGEFKVSERPITMPQLATALRQNKVHEMFGAGTACVVCPVGSILYQGEQFEVPTMKDGGKLCSRFYQTLMDIQYGRMEHRWSYTVNDLLHGIRRE
ncbi:Branched-chain-amino-acid aminotransferase, cytosolic [Holothuria leucospilota]|uniref:branched-chain-amino-acid transaminase n=1 Tax=Holothuria leucospilota TaxID=206669 RepID=A0A9Q0YJP6_HOLLE|nr:Branched-chain-amino-acid aminotransferase, cytosolic [Holothuria leucospilota]